MPQNLRMLQTEAATSSKPATSYVHIVSEYFGDDPSTILAKMGLSHLQETFSELVCELKVK